MDEEKPTVDEQPVEEQVPMGQGLKFYRMCYQ